jgi:small subunit ribosomal protein S16
MVVIRLSRKGTKKRPFYEIMVADRRRSRDGRIVESIGYFNPIASGKESVLEMKIERVDYWLSKGAKPSERVLSLIKIFRKGETALAKLKEKPVAKKSAKKKRAEQAQAATAATTEKPAETEVKAEAPSKPAEAAVKAEAAEAPKEEAAQTQTPEPAQTK